MKQDTVLTRIPALAGRAVALLLLVLAGHAFAMESGTLLQDEILREKPKAKAKVIGEVAKGVKVELLRISGDWYFVKIDNRWTGWVPVASVRRTDSTVGAGIDDLNSTRGMPSVTPAASGSLPPAKGSAFHRQ
jgi:hypothetical protein